MRKILLAGAAMLATTGVALAVVPSNSDSISVTTTLAPACVVDVTNSSVSLPADGSAAPAEGFSFSCNYGTGTATLSFNSGFDGVSSDGGVTSLPYNIVVSTGGSGVSTGIVTSTPTVPAIPNTSTAATFTLDLVNPLLVAGTYTDTLAISIAP